MAFKPFNWFVQEPFEFASEMRRKLVLSEAKVEDFSNKEKNLLLDYYRSAEAHLSADINLQKRKFNSTTDQDAKLKIEATSSILENQMATLYNEMAAILRVSDISLFSDFPVEETPPPPSTEVNVNTSIENEDDSSMIVDAGPSQTKQKRAHESDNDDTDWNTVQSKKKNNKSKENQLNPNPTNTPKREKIPPFYIAPIKTWNNLLSYLKKFAPSIQSSMRKNWIKITVDSEPEYRKIQSTFTQEKIQYRSFLLENEKLHKFVLRGLPANSPIEVIKREISPADFHNLNVTQLYRGNTKNRVPLPLFLIQMPRQQNNPDSLFQITELLGLRVQFEKYRGRKGPIQCHNCQAYFHSAAVCHLEPRCVKCAGTHKTAACTKTYEDPCKCVHCGGDHPANFRQCPKFPGAQGKNSLRKTPINAQNTPNLNSGASFPAKKANPAVSFAKAATGASPASTSTAPVGPKIQSAPQNGAISDADFLKQLLTFEGTFGKDVVLTTFQKCLPALRKAPTEIDRIFILYSNLPSIAH